MKEQEKRELEQRRRDAAIKSLYFNRYLLVRYVTAFFLFIYLYWLLMLYLASSPFYLLLIPASLLVFSGLCMWEMAQMFTREQKEATVSWRFYQTSIVVNIIVSLISLTQNYTLLFPFFNQSTTSLIVILAIQILGIFISLIILNRLKNIRQNTDKQYQRIQIYLKSVH